MGDEGASARALREHGSIRKAAAALGVPASTLQNRLHRAALRGEIGGPPIPDIAKPPPGFAISRNGGEYDANGKLRRQWVGTRRDAGEEFAVPAGHVVKGESALVDPDGRVLAKWIKTREGSAAGLTEALHAAFARYDGAAPALPPPASADEKLLTVYPLPDLHFGMFAWGKETGANYDTAIARDLVTRIVRSLVEQSRPSKRAVLLGLGDYFHANDEKAATPGSGHRLDVDGRWMRVFDQGAGLAISLVETLARKHERVEVVFLPGNHDIDAARTLTVALSYFFSATGRITVNKLAGLHWYRRFGRVLLGATHGHTMKPDRMAMMLATDRARDWGETEHKHMFFGHVHHESAREVGPVRVESFNTPAAKDAYAAGAGYRSGRSMSAITFHVDDGEIGRHRVNISTPRT